LQAATQQLFQLLAIPRRKLDLKPDASAHDSAIQPLMPLDKCLVWLPIHAVIILVLLCYKQDTSVLFSLALENVG
jgi:hypothetical protein